MKLLVVLFTLLVSICVVESASCSQEMLGCDPSCSPSNRLTARIEPKLYAAQACNLIGDTNNNCCLLRQAASPNLNFVMQEWCCVNPTPQNVIVNIQNVSYIRSTDVGKKRAVEETESSEVHLSNKQRMNIYKLDPEHRNIKMIHKLQNKKTSAGEIRDIYQDALIHSIALSRTQNSEKRNHNNKYAKKNEGLLKPTHTTNTKPLSLGDIEYENTIPFHGITVLETTKEVGISQDDYGDTFVVDTVIHGDAQNLANNFGWNIDRIDQRQLPLDQLYKPISNGSTGEMEVHVYIVDTGIDNTHSAFHNIKVSMDYPSTNGAKDCNGHGTHVGSTVGGFFSGVLLNTAIGNSTVKGKIVLHAIRVLGCDGSGTTFDVISGLLWIYDNVQHPAIISMSLGSSRSFNLDDIVSLLITDKNIPVIAAAGNDDSDACLVSPAGGAGVTAVGSTGVSDYISSFSNRGTCVDIFAPGEDVAGAYYGNSASYFSLSGTSMSTPHVTATVAAYCVFHQLDYPLQQLAKQSQTLVMYNASAGVVRGSLLGATNKLVYIGTETLTNVVPPEPAPSSGVLNQKNKFILTICLTTIICLLAYD